MRASTPDIRVKRIYETAEPDDGARILVDRLWPRGVSKVKAALTLWLKEIAPTTELRVWFDHDPAKFAEFIHRYRTELEGNSAAVAQVQPFLEQGTVTLLYGAHDEVHNHARVLADYLRAHVTPKADTKGP